MHRFRLKTIWEVAGYLNRQYTCGAKFNSGSRGNTVSKFKLLRVVAAIVAVVIFSIPLVAQQSKTQTSSQASPAGTWEWDREGPDGPIHCVLKLTEKNGKVKGKFTSEMVKSEIEEGTFEDGELTVKFAASVGEMHYHITLSGKVGNDKIKGMVLVDTGDEQREMDWLAQRTFPLDDVAGTWRMFFTTPDGQEMRPEFKVKNDDGKAVVEFVDDDDITISDVKYKNGNLKFTIELEFDGQPLEVEYDLDLVENSIDGVLYYSFANSGEEGELVVEGSRIK